MPRNINKNLCRTILSDCAVLACILITEQLDCGKRYHIYRIVSMVGPTRLFNRNFLLLWQGQFISKIGNEAHYIALAFWIKHATGSATMMGTVLMLSALPRVLLGPFGGAFADRRSRRAIIVIADAISGVSVLSLAALLFLWPEKTDLLLAWLFAVTIIVAVANAFFGPALGAAIPDIVPRERMAAANSVYRSTDQLSGFIGMGAGGVLFRILGAPLLFLFDGLSFIAAAIFSAFAKVPAPVQEKKLDWRQSLTQLKQDIILGFTYVWANSGLRSLFFTAAFLNFFFTPMAVLMPFFVEDTLHSTSDWFGYMMAAMGVGAMLGYVLAGTLKIRGKTRSWAIVIALVGLSALIGTVGLIQHPAMGVVLLAISGVLNGFININTVTILQLTTPTEIRGRVFGLLGTLGMALMPLAMGLSGLVADLMNQDLRTLFVACGVISVVLSLAVCFSGAFRTFLAYEPEPVIIQAEPAAQPPN